MKTTIVQRLEFKNLFASEEPKDIIEYLKKVPPEILLKTIGYCNTKPLPNYNSFFSNPSLQNDINQRVSFYKNINNIQNIPEVISHEASLRLAEVILSNKKSLIDDNKSTSINEGELNIFKAFLLLNQSLNSRQKLDNISKENFEAFIDYYIIFSFPIAELCLFDDDSPELIKLISSTIIKVEYLFDFLNSDKKYSTLKTEFIKSFNVQSEEDFIKHMKYLFSKIIQLKHENSYLFKVDDQESKDFLDSMISEEIKEDVDYTNIKNNPIYKLGKDIYSIINFFFVVDKFYRSTKFKLKEIYESDEQLKSKYGNFFGFYNTEFSEKFLMKKVLDQIFNKKYFYKKPETEVELEKEPDYYLRHNNDVYIFENKDVLVNKSIKSSADIEEVNKLLKTKFLEENGKPVGIGQLINSIEEIRDRKFRFDDDLNNKKKLTIYPILLIHDRIFQTPGINYRLNSWFREELKKRLKNNYKGLNIKDLTVIDIDTLIFWSDYLNANDKNLKNTIIAHLQKMNRTVRANSLEQVNKNITEKLAAISQREIPYKFDIKKFLLQLNDAFGDEVSNDDPN